MDIAQDMARAVAGAAAIALLGGLIPARAEAPLSDVAFRKLIIRESLAGYAGNCPCPYSQARNGSRCGARSAYSRPGGYAPICYPADISKADVNAYRRGPAR